LINVAAGGPAISASLTVLSTDGQKYCLHFTSPRDPDLCSDLWPPVLKARAHRSESRRQKTKRARQSSKQTAVSDYITEISAELARMAGEAKLPMLAYFLNLARVEAEMTTKRLDHAE
jgi:hypothetical protein